MAGLLLAAGAGRRAGGPKALRTDLPGGEGRSSLRVGAAGTWVQRAVESLLTGGCEEVTVVVGAEAGRVREVVERRRRRLGGDRPVAVVEATDWAEGMGASLRAGLQSLASRGDDGPGETSAGAGVDCAIVHLVDLPDVGPEVIERLLPLAAPDALARAGYASGPGHPVLLGRTHWPGVLQVAHGDQGARAYLRGRDVRLVDCSDLAGGADVDTPPRS